MITTIAHLGAKGLPGMEAYPKQFQLLKRDAEGRGPKMKDSEQGADLHFPIQGATLTMARMNPYLTERS